MTPALVSEPWWAVGPLREDIAKRKLEEQRNRFRLASSPRNQGRHEQQIIRKKENTKREKEEGR